MLFNKQYSVIKQVAKSYKLLSSAIKPVAYSANRSFGNRSGILEKKITDIGNNNKITKYFGKVATNPIKQVDTLSLPVIDLSDFIDGKSGNLSQCYELIEGLKKYGCLAVKDPRVNSKYNEDFIDNMEKYFENRGEKFYNGESIPDFKPEYSYQVGATPEFKETSRECAELIKNKYSEQPPFTPQPPPANALWRFFWRVGQVYDTDEKLLPPQVIPQDFPHWEKTMDQWGYLMKDSCFTVAEMLALGFGWKRNELTKQLDGGCNLLAPTGSNLEKFNSEGDVLSGFHYDLNFITIHGKSRYPGLFVWTTEGQKMSVKVPEGCLLIQCAKQLEWLTGGELEAGYHEVIVTKKAIDMAEENKKVGKSAWRVSSTLFSQVRLDKKQLPLHQFKNPENVEKYPETLCYDQVADELKAIGLLNED